jgi:hypothetical protein
MKKRGRARAWACLAGLCGVGTFYLGGCGLFWIEQGLGLAQFAVQAVLLGAVTQ